jgi:hypothetical protein
VESKAQHVNSMEDLLRRPPRDLVLSASLYPRVRSECARMGG